MVLGKMPYGCQVENTLYKLLLRGQGRSPLKITNSRLFENKNLSTLWEFGLPLILWAKFSPPVKFLVAELTKSATMYAPWRLLVYSMKTQTFALHQSNCWNPLNVQFLFFLQWNIFIHRMYNSYFSFFFFLFFSCGSTWCNLKCKCLNYDLESTCFFLNFFWSSIVFKFWF
jgi:hypothetical protein